MGVLGAVNGRRGRSIMCLARVTLDPEWGRRREMRSQSFTIKMVELSTV
ncbi:DUF4113 domain-containing protein [Pseudomonas sp. Irchel s3b5]|nr:DUF4113 domain-containing protein [Pseudomonas sp. Irchel s3b5]